MQLGTRWVVGTAAPAALSPAVIEAVAAVEGDLEGIDVSQWRWTLTWLEGRPVVELDDGTTIRVDSAGSVTIHPTED
jgi:hypothetical protein